MIATHDLSWLAQKER